MGFFKDIATLNKVGKEARKGWDPVAQMQQGQIAMAQTSAMLAEMANRANSTAALNGTPAMASIVAIRESGRYLNMQPVLAIELLVPTASGFPVPVTINEVVSQLHLARLQPGSSLAVKVGATPQDVVIDWYRFGSTQLS
jgi:hypothetical protein